MAALLKLSVSPYSVVALSVPAALSPRLGWLRATTAGVRELCCKIRWTFLNVLEVLYVPAHCCSLGDCSALELSTYGL